MSVSISRPALGVAITQAYPHLGAPIQPMNPAMHNPRADFANIDHFSAQGGQFANWHGPYDGTQRMQRQAMRGNTMHMGGVSLSLPAAAQVSKRVATSDTAR